MIVTYKQKNKKTFKQLRLIVNNETCIPASRETDMSKIYKHMEASSRLKNNLLAYVFSSHIMVRPEPWVKRGKGPCRRASEDLAVKADKSSASAFKQHCRKAIPGVLQELSSGSAFPTAWDCRSRFIEALQQIFVSPDFCFFSSGKEKSHCLQGRKARCQ